LHPLLGGTDLKIIECERFSLYTPASRTETASLIGINNAAFAVQAKHGIWLAFHRHLSNPYP
jgi:hypothetical protein